jgi:isoamylase
VNGGRRESHLYDRSVDGNNPCARFGTLFALWDVGAGGYQVGNFPVLWSEWNGKYRDTVGRFWKGDGDTLAEFATRLSGSSDLYQYDGHKPSASINFITCHDGFTLRDLVSYNDKHNEANGENNQDGANDNNSWSCVVEDLADDPAINALRWQQQRNSVTTLLLLQGVPMLLAGDELSHTQQGSNNTYCQDNKRTWLNWELSEEQQAFHAFVRAVIQLQRTQPVFQRRKFFQGRPIRGEGILDISWFDPSRAEMTEEAWNTGYARCLGVRWAGDLIGETDEKGDPIVGDTILLLMNAHHEAIPFTLPDVKEGQQWERLLHTRDYADRRLPQSVWLGLRRRQSLCPHAPLWDPRRLPPLHRPGACAGDGGNSGCGLQPYRPRGERAAALLSRILYGPPQHKLGRGDQLQRRPCRSGP